MCLAIGGRDYCLTLRTAPYYRGGSLEGYQHGIEENHSDVMRKLTAGLERAIARACSTTLAEYRARTVAVHSNNVRLELMEGHIPLGFGGGDFMLERVYFRYVSGTVDHVPPIERIDETTQAFANAFFVQCRNAYARIVGDDITRGSYIHRAREAARVAMHKD